jgi:hypothetical protein
MHQQYLITRDIKFPDQKQYAKPGDLIMFNDHTGSLSIYRNASLIGTVHFSASGLQEFLRLGWIVRPSSPTTPPPAPVPLAVAPVASEVPTEERTIEAEEGSKPRKAKKS